MNEGFIKHARYGVSGWACYLNTSPTVDAQACVNDNKEMVNCKQGSGMSLVRNTEILSLIERGCPSGLLSRVFM